MIKTLWLAGKRLIQDQYTDRAAALAFTTLIAIVPLVSVMLSIFTLFPFFTRFIRLAQDYIFANFLPASSNAIQHYFQAFIAQATHLPVMGILFLLSTAITLIIMVENTLNSIWNTPKRKKKLLTMIIYWAVLLSTPIVLGLSIIISSYIFSMSWLASTMHTLQFLKILPLLINTAIFTVLYVVVPNQKVKLRHGMIGGLIAAVLFETAKKGFAFYIQHFPSYELIYGTLATIPIFLIWVYICWLVVLYGALVTYHCKK